MKRWVVALRRRHVDAPAGKNGRPLLREERRAAFLNEARGETPYVAVALGEQLFFVRTDDRGVGRGIFLKGWRKDLAILDGALASLAEYGVVLPLEPMFVDVGANMGTTTVMALRRHAFVSGVAIEPSPENYRTLRLNLVANDIDPRVRAIRAAASDHAGEAALDVSKDNWGGHRVVEAGEAAAELRVPTVTLDGLVADGLIDPERVGLLWVDAVGHEGEVLTGATKLIEAGVPVVMSRRADLVLGEKKQPVVALVTASYTDVVELRDFLTRHPIDEFGDIVDSFRHSTDLLLLRR